MRDESCAISIHQQAFKHKHICTNRLYHHHRSFLITIDKMKATAVLALAASASAAVVQERQDQSTPIGSFSADCIPHSTECAYNFTVTLDPGLPLTHCGAFLQGPDQLPDVTEGSCPDNVAYTWSITKTTTDSLNFALWYPISSRSNVTYCHTILPEDITTENDGAVSTQHYTGPANFSASIFDCA
ncbi:hypothetical protein BJ170DRAFT_607987 [Xylariales sp. AK1849]|nr:hypothetical protein BJ170DRAFT_607987 [Xylariales sp. AK1849]